MFSVGATVKVFGHRLATVTSVHPKRKTLGVTYHGSGAATFVKVSKVVAA